LAVTKVAMNRPEDDDEDLDVQRKPGQQLELSIQLK
jgi:hypothetical protein